MPRSCKTQIRYGSGTINPTPNGKFDCFIMVDGARKRARVANIALARAWIDMQEHAGNINAPPLTNLQMADAQRAVALLPEGYTLVDAARRLAEQKAQNNLAAGLTMAAAWEAFEKDRTVAVAKRTMTGYRYAVSGLIKYAGEETDVGTITKSMVVDYLDGLHPVTRNGKLRSLAVFFRWCAAQGAIQSIPTETIAKSKEHEPPKGVFTPAEAKRLMQAAEKVAPDMVPYLALGLFAGIRPAELLRLPANKIKGGYILLDGQVTKTADARTITIRENLQDWLEAYPPQDNKICPDTLDQRGLYERLALIRKAADVSWPRDGLRHSFATYAYELTKDAATVAAEMGHQGTGVFFKHYRALAHPGDGKKFFEIRPKTKKRGIK